MPGRRKKVGAPKKLANAYKMPPHIPPGEVIHDTILKRSWRIGPSIGVGGFGEIYSACDHETSPKKGSSYPYVVKIEPQENGPLFVEMHFYIRNANKQHIENFMKAKKLSSLGMPTFYGSGSHVYKGEKLRYLVLEKYGKDIWKIFTENGRSFPAPTVFQLGLQMLDVLEYIHSRGYVHADIKGANILMGLKKGSENQAYLVDFGLALRMNDKEFMPDPKCAHNGTIEYTSRDAHLGVSTMRGDLEILGYNLLQWLVGSLPWEQVLTNPKKVQAMKEEFMKDVKKRIANDYPDVPDALVKFFEHIKTLKPKEMPNYTKCHQIFESYLKSQGKTRTSKLEFSPSKKTKTKRVADEYDSEDDLPLKQNGDGAKRKRGTKPKVKTTESDNENTVPDDREDVVKQDGDAVKRKRGRKPKPKATDSNENKLPDESQEESKKLVRSKKRKSSDPAVIYNVKMSKLAMKATPPRRSPRTKGAPRQVSFDSPICEVIGENKSTGIRANSVNSSGDIFDDSFEIDENKKVKRTKRRLLSVETITVTKVVKKKFTTGKKGRSWKDTSAIVNGRSPPK